MDKDREKAQEILENVRSVSGAACLFTEQAIVEAFRDLRRMTYEKAAKAAENVVPRHTECGNKIAAAIRRLGEK